LHEAAEIPTVADTTTGIGGAGSGRGVGIRVLDSRLIARSGFGSRRIRVIKENGFEEIHAEVERER